MRRRLGNAFPIRSREPWTCSFVTLRSQSTGQHFRLFIRHGPLQVTAEEGGFTCYGLSKGGFVPWF
ncbi:type I-F CRISPR-associated endoribonuclease Cas6/Csy4 [Pseudomonas aeruginosa]|uniref:type I-F CRISPR-associated endoribonuclease Cas6/Csy4 n=1 Tax=Pseudomonas aeruginosa TaxID=287 RepID=UPI0021F15C8A|nr:type I-F CRISPR-associated endoribonuclease Cas6/Csy4 [Pseudomonas aeruginosa]UYM59389.1 type I-F CRISPR-associated endoribonuclease Cas6/Csy4 [Pseudomonas aeruginosa]